MDETEIHTKSAEETKEYAKDLGLEIKKMRASAAIVVAFEGGLGAGKTTFVQGFAEAFGITEKVLSPTFVLMKMYQGEKNEKHLIHIDCYRLHSSEELLHLGFQRILRDKDAVLLIEWANKIKDIIPNDAIWIKMDYGKDKSVRIITIQK